MKVGIGYSNTPNARLAGQQVGLAALENGGLDQPALVMAFCHGRLDHQAYYDGLRDVLGMEIPIVGGSAIGVITNSDISYEGYPAAAAVLQFHHAFCQLVSTDELFKFPQNSGQRLAKQLEWTVESNLLILLYDSVKFPAADNRPAVLNPSASLLQALTDYVPTNVLVAGAGLLGDYQFSNTWQFTGHQISSQSALALLFSGVQSYIATMHGCYPINQIEHSISRIYGQFLYQLDGKPVMEVIDELYGHQDWRQQSTLKELSLGIHCGNKSEPPHEGHYKNRLISGILPDEEGIILFEPDLVEGDRVQFMRRDPALIIKSAHQNTERLLQEIKDDGKTPSFALYFDCAGRVAAIDGTETEEAAEVQKLLNQHKIPLLGIYCGVEIAPFQGKSHGLDWTGVLVILCR
jgi:hypothetical protein